MIKAVFFDVDGTLIPFETGKMPETTSRCIELLRKQGIKCIVCTGRHKCALDTLPIDLDAFDGFLTLNGQICLDDKRQMYSANEIDPGEAEILISTFRAKKIPFLLIGEDSMYINYVDDMVINTQQNTNGKIPDISEYKGEKIYQCCAYVTDRQREVLSAVLDECSITSWYSTGIDIMPKGGGKAAGMGRFFEKYNITKEETMAFGDGENDIPMLTTAGIGVAMGSASEMVKQAADYVTDSAANDGIMKALVHFGLIDEAQLK